MDGRIQIVFAGSLLFLCTTCDGIFAHKQLRPAVGEAPDSQLAVWLKKEGYVEVPVTLNKTGLLDVKAEVEGIPTVFVVDTGSNNINLDRSLAKRARLTVKEVEEKTAAFRDTVATTQAKIAKLSVGKICSPAGTCVVDLGHVNGMRKENGDADCDGILGGSFLMYYSAVIDYGHHKLYLLDPEHQTKELSRLAGTDGFTDVALDLSKLGLLDVKVEANGVLMLMCVDTGTAPDGILDAGSAKRAKLEVQNAIGPSVGVGGAHPNRIATIDHFAVGGAPCQLAVWVQDFSASNRLRSIEGVSATDGTLGGAFFEKHSAIIDYGHRMLYLLPPVGR